MKSFLQFIVLIAVLAIAIFHPAGMAMGVVAGAVTLFLAGNALASQGSRLCVTLTATEILADCIDAFKIRFPMLRALSTTFTAQRAALNATVTGHIKSLPSVASYDATTGYANGATEASDLLTDVPVVLSQHKHVPLKVGHLIQIASQKNTYQDAINDAVYVLGKSIVDYALAYAKPQNFSYTSTETIANTDRDTLGDVRKDMNWQGSGDVRFGIVNSDFAEKLDTDSRIASKDYYGQQTGATPYLALKGIAGFKEVWEYPSMPDGNTTVGTFTAVAATNVITTSAAHGKIVGDRVRVSSATTLPAGMAAATTYYVLTVPSTTTMTVSATLGGAVLDITDTGTGVHTMTSYENVSAFFFDPRAIVIVTALPDHNFDLAAELGIPQVMKTEVVTDEESGLSFMGLMWQQQGTGDIYLTVAVLYGVAAGKQLGAAAAICDKAGHLVITA